MKATYLALGAAMMLVAGVFGGLISHWAFAPGGAQAQAATALPDVTTRRLRVMDAQNRVRLSMLTLDDRNGAPGLALSDAAGRIRTLVNVTEDDQPFVSLYDRDGHERSTLTVLDDGRPILNFWSAEDKLRASIRVLADGGAGAAIYDQDGHVRAILGVDDRGEPSVTLLDADGRPLGPARSLDAAVLRGAFDGAARSADAGSLLRDTLAALSAANP